MNNLPARLKRIFLAVPLPLLLLLINFLPLLLLVGYLAFAPEKNETLGVTTVQAQKRDGGDTNACVIGSPDDPKWAPINEYDAFFTRAAEEFGVDGNLLKAMAYIESGGQGHAPGGKVLERDDGFGDGLSIGLMQVKPSIWQSLVPDADAYDAQGNIRLGAAIMAKAIRDYGSWEKALTTVYFPANDPNGTTQQDYVDMVNELMTELGGAGCDSSPSSPDTTPIDSGTDESDCVITKVGEPKVSPTPPPNCATAGGGNYRFPLESVAEVTGIATEMGSYAGGFTYKGHVEHAGLDIGTTVNKRVPVYAIADGEVVESRILGPASSCETEDAGCNVTIRHSGDQFSSLYTHIDSSVQVGQKVKKGDRIGQVHVWTVTVGNDHLHFELRLTENNYNINPRLYFPELEQFPISPGYNGDVRAYSASRNIFLEEGGGTWAEKFRDHPPCPKIDLNGDGVVTDTDCWAM